MKTIDAPFYEELEYRNLKVKYQIALSKLFNNEDALKVLESSEDIPISLKDIYVPLRVDKTELTVIERSEDVERIVGNYVDEVLEKNQFVAFSGLAGSGKSTLTKFLSITLSETEINEDIKKLGRKIVVPFILRELDFSQINSLEQLWEEWIKDFSKRLDVSLNRDFFDYYVNNGWAILVFDGFDELGDEKNRELISWLNRWIKTKKLTNNNSKTNIILTSRPTGFLKDVDYSKFEKFFIQPFNQAQIKDFVQNFFTIRYHYDKVLKSEKINSFLDKLENFKGLVELKHRPIYLSMLGYISEVDGEIPNSRALAYKKMVEAYVHQLDLQKNLDHKKGHCQLPTWNRSDRVEFLEEFAYKLHNLASKNNINEVKQLQLEISREKLRVIFRDILDSTNFITITKDTNVEDLEKYFLARTGLLVEPREGFIQFSHLSFQEFLVAKRIHRKQPKRNIEKYLKKEIFDKLDKVGWAEIAQLFFGIDTIEQGEGQSEILHFLIKENNFKHYEFLYNLIFTTDNKLNSDDKKRWLTSLLFLFIHSENIYQLRDLIVVFEKNLKLLDIDLTEYLEKSAISIVNKQDIDRKSLIKVIEEDEDDLAYKITHIKIDNLKELENILYIGLYFTSFKESFLTKEILSKLPKDKKENNFVFSLDKYIPLNKELKHDIADVVINNTSPYDFVELNGSLYLSYSTIFTTNNFYRDILKIQLFINKNTLFLLTKNLVETDLKNMTMDRKFAKDRNRDIVIAMLMTKDSKDKDMSRARNMAMARSMLREIAMVGKMASGMMDRFITSDFYMEMARDMNMGMNMDIDMVMDTARSVHMNMNRDTANKYQKDIINLGLKSWLFSLYGSSKLFAKEAGLDIDISKDEYKELYETLRDNPLKYFEKYNLNSTQKEEIKELFEKSYLLKTMEYTLENTKYKEFDEDRAVKSFFDDVKSFNKKFSKLS